MPLGDSAVVVPVPAADPLLDEFLRGLDPRAAAGIGAHVTVLYPFLPAHRIGPDELRRLGGAVASVRRFAARFARVAWTGDAFVWLAPEPGAGFRALTAAVTAAFPGLRPYGGAYGDDPEPHLTLGEGDAVDPLRAAAAVAATRLPVDVAVEACHLMTGGEDGAWRRTAVLPLGRG